MNSKRRQLKEYEEAPGDCISRVLETKGSHLFTVEIGAGEKLEALLPNRFKNKVWIRRGSFVVIRRDQLSDSWSIEHVLSKDEIKQLEKQGKW